MSFPSKWSVVAALGSTLVLAHVERASAAPDDDKGRAASLFEAGATAFKAKNYEEAAKQFEAADDAAPASKSLRLAIRARVEAGDGAQATSLAALAQKLYPSDADVAKIAHDTIARFGAKLEAIDVTCSAACTLSTGAHSVHGGSRTSWTVYVDPGSAALTATFGDKDAPAQTVKATAGGSASLSFDEPKATPPKGETTDTSSDSTKPADGDNTPKTSSSSSSDSSDGASGNGEQSAEATTTPKKHWGIHPAVFGVSLGLTAALGATTIWSGIDTQNNPGPDAVKKQCAGLGMSCPAYQTGLSNQRRTNILIGVISGLGALTVIFAAVTNWHGSAKADAAPPSGDPNNPPADQEKPAAVTDLRLWLDVASANPSSVQPTSTLDSFTSANGAVVGLSGRF